MPPLRAECIVLLSVVAACGGSDPGPSLSPLADAGSPSVHTPGAADTGAEASSGGADGSVPDGGSDSAASARCFAAPDAAFNPMAAYVAPSQVASVTVTSAADDGPGSLRQAIASAAEGAVIGFAPALAHATIAPATTLGLSQSVTLDGSAAPGVTLDGRHAVGLFAFNGDKHVVFRFFSLTFANGFTSGSGGAISLNGGDLELEVGGCRFENNQSGEGGAIRVGYRPKPAFIHDSVFTGNDGTLPGPRSGFSGGAISSVNTAFHVVRSRFENNIGPTSGAVYTIHSNPLVEDSVFVANKSSATGGSGAFFADGGGPGDYNNPGTVDGSITLARSRFENNRGAGDDSGAGELYAYPRDTVTVQDCVFHANRGDPGRAGALFIHADKQVSVVRSAFADNHATGQGGAIWADGAALYQFENVLFSGNATDSDFGGALRLNVDASSKIRIAFTTFADNVAASGNGAIWMAGKRDATVANSIFANNTVAGGQINFPVTDGGGNLEWPAAPQRALPTATLIDPGLLAAEDVGGRIVRALAPASPAIDHAVAPPLAVDGRDFSRDAKPDIGAYEANGTCGP